MRTLLISLLLLTSACRQQEPGIEPQPAPGASAGSDALSVYAGAGRDRACLAVNGGTSGVITYAAQGDANCSIRGTIVGSYLEPAGDGTCKVALERQGDRLTLRTRGSACDYYCGPGASIDGRTFVRMDKPGPVTDIAGDPLC